MKTIKMFLGLIIGIAALAAPPVHAQGSIKLATTLDNLRYLAPDPATPIAFVAGWTTQGDGGGGFYVWNAASALTTNYSIVASYITTKTVTQNGVTTTLYLAGYGGQWIRIPGPPGTLAPRTQTLVAATAVKAEAPSIRVVGTSGATTLTATPTIAANGLIDGQELRIEGTSDTDTVILQDEGGATGTKLELGASTRTLGVGDFLTLKYNSGTGKWYEIGFNNN